jgi:tRNA (guanine37-N1)-methyltransferase
MPTALRFDVFTLFPDVFEPYLQTSILQRARQRDLVAIYLHNIRDWATDRHHVTDDDPYGGGGGMVMKPEPIFAAVESVLGAPPACPLILLTPQGRLFNQAIARELAGPALERPTSGSLTRERPVGDIPVLGHSQLPAQSVSVDEPTETEPDAGKIVIHRLALLCGRYEGVDERVRAHLVSDEISIGDYVLTGGELAAMVVIDAVTRLVPGVLGDPDGPWDDSHASGLLEYPHYTRPPEFRNWNVPEILLSGDHARVARWRREQALLRTWQRRPDLLKTAQLSEQELEFLERLEEKKTKR